MTGIEHLGFLGQPQAACPSPGLVPGVCYPAGFPSTPAYVTAGRLALTADTRAAMARQFKASAQPAGVDAAHTAYARVAWDALQAAIAAQDWMRPARAVESLRAFTGEYDAAVADWQARWNARHAPKEALRAYLRALPANQAVGQDAALEAERQSIGYLDLAHAVVQGASQRVSTLDAIRQQRDTEWLSDMLASLRAIPAAVGSTLREAVRIIVQDIVAPLVGALVPWWLWPVGLFLGWRLIASTPAVQAIRRVVR